jgi:branched-chain amino acid transport system permease protein
LEIFFQVFLAGAITGSAYGLVALAISLIYNSTRVVNFGQGDQVMLAAMLAAVFLGALNLPAIPALVLIAVILALAGVIWDRLVYSPLLRRRAPPISIGLGTLGAGIAVSGLVLTIFGPNELFVPSLLPAEVIAVGPVATTWQRAIVLPIFALLILATYLFLNRTMFGLAVRATGYNREVAQLMGVRVRTVVLFSFVFSGLMSAVTGILIGPLLGATFSLGLFYTVKGFMAAIVGGIDSPFAAVAGGLLIGFLEVFVAGYVNSLYGEPIVFALALAVLLIRPSGLLREKEG